MFNFLLDYDKKFKCFICNIEKTEFTKQGHNFNQHREVDHNLWNYIYFLTHIKEKNSSDFNGTESYIQEKWEEEDLSWFPIGKAGVLREDEEKEENKGLEAKFKRFMSRILHLRKEEGLGMYVENVNGKSLR